MPIILEEAVCPKVGMAKAALVPAAIFRNSRRFTSHLNMDSSYRFGRAPTRLPPAILSRYLAIPNRVPLDKPAYLRADTSRLHFPRLLLCDAGRRVPTSRRDPHPAVRIRGREPSRPWRPTRARPERARVVMEV